MTSVLYQLTGLYMIQVFTEKNFKQTVSTNLFISTKGTFLHKNAILNSSSQNGQKILNILSENSLGKRVLVAHTTHDEISLDTTFANNFYKL